MERQIVCIHRAWILSLFSCRTFDPTLQPSYLFKPDTIDILCLLCRLSGSIDMLCHELRRYRHLCNRLTIRHSDQGIVHRTMSFTIPTQWEVKMFPFLHKLLLQCLLRRVRVRNLTIRANSFRPPPQQLSLFDAHGETKPQEPPRTHRLALALDRLRARFGMKCIAWARSYPAEPNHRIYQ